MSEKRVNQEVERLLELAAAVGLDPRKLWPPSSGGFHLSGFELDAYLHNGARAQAQSKLDSGYGPKRFDGPGAEQRRALSAAPGPGSTFERSVSGRRTGSEKALSALGAAGQFLLSPAQAEAERLDSLRETALLHSGAEEVFDRVVIAARKYFDVGAASLSLIAEDA